jgi:hypothetical protein
MVLSECTRRLNDLSEHTRDHNHAFRHGQPPIGLAAASGTIDAIICAALCGDRCQWLRGFADYEYFASNGWKVFAFARRPGLTTASNQVHVPFQLDARVNPAVFRDNGISSPDPLRYDFRPVNWVDIHRVNVEGSTRLLRSPKKAALTKSSSFLQSVLFTGAVRW